MSLVSYADSDDSGEEDIIKPEVQNNEEKNEDKALKLSKTHSSTKSQLSLKNKKTTEQADLDADKTKPKSIGSLFSSLPAPWMSTVSWANKSSGKKSGTNQKGRGQKTIKISLPSLVDNSDSDEEEPVRKVITAPAPNSQTSSGLFSRLPKPKHSVVVKESNPNRPVAKISNRPLIPDSLRRKPVKKQVKKPKPETKKDDSDDDSDGETTGGSFFSWNEQETSTTKDVPSQTNSQATPGNQAMPDAGTSSQVGEQSNDNVIQTQQTGNVFPSMKPSPSSGVTKTIPSVIQETRNTESVQHFSQSASVSNIHTNEPSEYFENSNFYTDNNVQGYSQQGTTNTTDYSYQPYYDYYNSEQYNQATTEQEQNYPDWQSPAQPTVQETPEQFKKFLGKRGRGEENINIIDVNVDDQVGSAQEWKQHYHKEDADYKPQSKKKDNLPSSQQRKKHQITYLAFQAKEKEWELRNQWSANRQTKRQTQSKYGF